MQYAVIYLHIGNETVNAMRSKQLLHWPLLVETTDYNKKMVQSQNTI